MTETSKQDRALCDLRLENLAISELYMDSASASSRVDAEVDAAGAATMGS